MSNTLFYGDNLDVLRERVADASVDLVYLDPPFQSGKDYRVIFESHAGKAREDRLDAEAFTDTWRWNDAAEASYADVERGGGHAATTLRALRSILGESDVMAYLCMMAPRLVELRRALRSTGSLYLHCDPTASHYLKVLLDGVFGPACFRNELIWRYRRWPTKAHRFQRMHDVLLFYTASATNAHTFHTLYGYEKLAESTLKTFGTKKQRADFSSGRRKPGVEEVETAGPPLTDYWDIGPADEPRPPLSDAWEVGVIAAIGKERTGYPTQKPEALLERVIRASSNEGDVVLDPFCGCGTTLAVAERLGRRWIGIDVTHHALTLVRARMKAAAFDVRGAPGDAAEAHGFARDQPAQFRAWALGLLGARPVSNANPNGGGANLDGELVFRGASKGAPDGRVVIALSAGLDEPVDVRDVRALRAAVSRSAAAGGVLLTSRDATDDSIAEAAKAGFYESEHGTHARIQIVTMAEILGGRGIDFPGTNVTGLGAARRAGPRERSRPFPGVASIRPTPSAEGPRKSGT